MLVTNIAIIVPVYNEGALFNDFILKLTGVLAEDARRLSTLISVVCIDDGSREPVHIRPEVTAAGVGIYLLRHKINFGQGAALQTGIEFARDKLQAQIFVTMDSDGQHSPQDVSRLVEKLHESDVDIVFGTRFGAGIQSNVPPVRRYILKCAIIFENFLTGVTISDAHNGFRAFNRKFADQISLKQNKMAHATEFKLIVSKGKFKYAEEKVQIVYSKESLAKGQRNTGAILILRDLLRMFIFDRG